ncbi:DUF6671 family protein [Thioalkalivibrio sp.]|uniref:DUF6671 family protein n=1 Tax=Thioalkalivibrio sp. TaxID=2093813 RepID=UPI0039751A3E
MAESLPDNTGAYSLAGRSLVLLTRHGKERVIAPTLEPALGCRLDVIDSFDTDRLGTFTREIPRAGTQLEAARRKARIGMELTGSSFGLASEGAFGPDPGIGLIPWNVEYVILLDDLRGLELAGQAQGPARQAHRSVTDWEAMLAFAEEAGFPDHHLVLRPDHENDPRIRKGIGDLDALERAFDWARAHATSGRVFVESDLRAHCNPTRMQMIARATEDLLARLGSLCPACGAPGFWIVERIPGLPCADCGAPTRQARAEVQGCIACPYRETRPADPGQDADPAVCDWCNP